MPFTPKGPTPELYVVPRPADNQSMKAAEDGGVPEFTAVSAETVERWGFNTRLTGELARDLTPQRGMQSITSTAPQVRPTTDS